MGNLEERPGAVVPWTIDQDSMQSEMTGHVSRFLGDRAKYEKAVENAAATAKRFTMARLATYYIELFARLAGSP
jgi:hypothetical protein